ncbi:hypothetical protein AB0D11_24295 [Streptomyces monashensis]
MPLIPLDAHLGQQVGRPFLESVMTSLAERAHAAAVFGWLPEKGTPAI